MTRRAFFATLLAPFVARFLPRPELPCYLFNPHVDPHGMWAQGSCRAFNIAGVYEVNPVSLRSTGLLKVFWGPPPFYAAIESGPYRNVSSTRPSALESDAAPAAA